MQGIKELLGRFGRFFERPELHALDDDTIAQLSRDVGVTRDELYALEQTGSRPVLMPSRLAHEGVSPVVVQAEWPSVWKDLQRVCSLCSSKDVCQHEFELAPDAPDWHRYCGNEGTIKSLQDTLALRQLKRRETAPESFRQTPRG